MNDNRQLKVCDIGDIGSLPHTSKGKRDLIILRYMARRVQATLHLPEQQMNTPQPWLYMAKERHGRTHRIALYNSQDLLQASSMAFVGFVSARRKAVMASIVEEIHAVDARLVTELATIPGILSYSSLELRDGNWYNLVLFSDASAKVALKKTSIHAYAAYQLAPHYYEWIRLHNGIMPEGLAYDEMTVQKTRYYTFEDSPVRSNTFKLAQTPG